MTMDPLATIEDVEARLGRVLDAGEDERVAALLDDASAAVRAYTGQGFTSEETTARLIPRNGKLNLPQRPVTAVSAVKTVDGDDIVFTWWIGNNVTVGATNLNWFEVNGVPSQPLDVTYTHGYDTVPADIVAVVCQIVGRAMTKPADEAGYTQESIAGYSYALGAAAAAGAVGMLNDEKAVLDRYRRPGGSARLAS
jgi:hypothetical protein